MLTGGVVRCDSPRTISLLAVAPLTAAGVSALDAPGCATLGSAAGCAALDVSGFAMLGLAGCAALDAPDFGEPTRMVPE